MINPLLTLAKNEREGEKKKKAKVKEGIIMVSLVGVKPSSVRHQSDD